MIKNERIIRSDGEYELVIDSRNTLRCQRLNNQNENDDNTQSFRQGVDSIWLHRNCCVMYDTDGNVRILRGYYDQNQANDYKLTISDEVKPPFKVPGLKFLNASNENDQEINIFENRNIFRHHLGFHNRHHH